MKLSLEQRIALLPNLDKEALVEQYLRLLGETPSRRLPRSQIELAIAYRLQKQLNANLRSKMMQALLASDAIESILSSNSSHAELVREWRGRLYSVTLLDYGVMYGDKHYLSLSDVARLITGKRCSGTEFFGVSAKSSREK